MSVTTIAVVQEQLVERERWLLHPGPSTDVAALLADTFVEIGASGRQWQRDEAVDLVEARRNEGVGDYELSEISCRALGGSAYLLTYTICTAERTSLRASIWDVIGERWQLIYHQGTTAPG